MNLKNWVRGRGGPHKRCESIVKTKMCRCFCAVIIPDTMVGEPLAVRRGDILVLTPTPRPPIFWWSLFFNNYERKIMNTKKLLSIAVIATLPFAVHAGNISGAMYIAPSASDNNHPAPTANAAPPYGRIDIDTADQEHIATTAYVKGAYNSAIAAVNKVNSTKQGQLVNIEDRPHDIADAVLSSKILSGGLGEILETITNNDAVDSVYSDIAGTIGVNNLDETLITAGATLNLIRDTTHRLYVDKQNELGYEDNQGNWHAQSGDLRTSLSDVTQPTQLVTGQAVVDAINDVNTTISNKRVEVCTTWDNDNAKIQVAFVDAQ